MLTITFSNYRACCGRGFTIASLVVAYLATTAVCGWTGDSAKEPEVLSTIGSAKQQEVLSTSDSAKAPEALSTLPILLTLPVEHQKVANVQFLYNRVIVNHGARKDGSTSSSVAVLDRTGHEIFSREPRKDLPVLREFSLRATTLTPTGLLVVSVFSMNLRGEPATSLLYYDPTQGRFVRTDNHPAGCYRLTCDRDALWCLGATRPKPDGSRGAREAIYKFDLEGRLLDSFFSRDELPVGIEPVASTDSSLPRIMAQDGRVVAWLPGLAELFEFRDNGKFVRRLPFPGQKEKLAGRILSGREDVLMLPNGAMVGLFFLAPAGGDRSNIEPVLITVSPTDDTLQTRAAATLGVTLDHLIVGVDGDQLVLWNRVNGNLELLDLNK